MTYLRDVRLYMNNLNGSLPNDFFSQLPQLEVISLDNNKFEGSIPPSIGNSTSLINLGLSSNFFTGMLHCLCRYFTRNKMHIHFQLFSNSIKKIKKYSFNLLNFICNSLDHILLIENAL